MEQKSPFTAFSYMFKDNKFWVKYGTFFIMTIICLLPRFIQWEKASLSQILLYGFIVLAASVVNILYYGYLCSGIKSISEQKENFMIPFFNFKTHGIIGLKMLVASLLFGLAFFVVLMLVSMIFGFLSALLPNFPIIGAILVVLFTVAAMFYYPAFIRMFAITQSFFAFFKLKEIFQSVASDCLTYTKHVLLLLLFLAPIFFAGMLLAPLTVVFPIVKYILALIIVVFCAYSNMGFMYICAKCIK